MPDKYTNHQQGCQYTNGEFNWGTQLCGQLPTREIHTPIYDAWTCEEHDPDKGVEIPERIKVLSQWENGGSASIRYMCEHGRIHTQIADTLEQCTSYIQPHPPCIFTGEDGRIYETITGKVAFPQDIAD